MTKFVMFTKNSCGPCGLVKKYINALNDDRSKHIEEVYLDDFANEPIPEENLKLARKYGVTATPVLLVIKGDDEDCVLEELVGGMTITQNIRRLWETYYE